MGAFRFDFSLGSPRAEPVATTPVSAFVTMFRPGARKVTIEGSAALLGELLGEAPSGTVVRQREMRRGEARVELNPAAEPTWPILATACARPVRIELRGARGRDRIYLLVSDRGATIQGFVDDPSMLVPLEAELRAWGSFTPRPAPRDGGGFGMKRLALIFGAVSVGGRLGRWPLQRTQTASPPGITAVRSTPWPQPRPLRTPPV